MLEVRILLEDTNTDFKVASILDEFDYECLKYECDLIQLSIYSYKEIIMNEKPHFLLVGSAWEGKNGEWTGRIIYKNNLLRDLVALCKKMKIPTVFWSKEDPVNFKYFIEAAKLFDYIFTADSDSIKKYNSFCKHNNIFVLPHAAQIKIHNPIDKDREKIGKVAFAGSWYGGVYPDRKKDMEIILNSALKYNLHIYDRNHNKKVNAHFRFPHKYRVYIKGGLPYKEMIEMYKKYDVFLNVNIVKNSPTMHSMRVFELLACGINLISTYSKSIEKNLSKIIKICKNKEEAEKYLNILIHNKEYRDRLSLLGQREVFNKHTYHHRFETILENLKLNTKKKDLAGVSIVTYIQFINELENVIDNYKRQNYEKKELIIVLYNKEINLKEGMEKSKGYDNVMIFQMDEKKSIGECVNFATGKAKHNYIAMFHSSCYYGPSFISDLMNGFKYTNAGVIGKCTHYIYEENRKMLDIRFPDMENRYVNHVAASSYIFRKEILDEIKFSYTENEIDNAFIKKCIENNIKIYSADRFNFVSIKQDLNIEKCKVVHNYKAYVTI